MTNMQKYAPHFADGAMPLQVGVGLTRMAVTPRQLRLFCSGTLCGRGYGDWFSPSTGQRSGLYVHPVGVAPVPTRSGPQVTIQGYRVIPFYLVISLACQLDNFCPVGARE